MLPQISLHEASAAHHAYAHASNGSGFCVFELSNRFDPALVIYLAGADPFAGDRLGRLKLSADGLEARDRRVFDWCFGCSLPVAFVMAGGYGRQIEEAVQIQLATYRVALLYW